MRNKVIISAVVIILLSSAVSASASNDHANEQGQKNEDRKPVSTSQVSPTGTIILSNEGEDDCDDNVKNHGDFVSCVAHEGLGGDRVSEAAHSDIGKKDDEDDDNNGDDISPTITPIVSVTPTVTPSGTVTPTPSVTESPIVTPTVTPTITPEQEQGLLNEQVKGLLDQIKDLLSSLTSFLR